MDSQEQILGLVVVVAAVYGIARRTGALPPLLLVSVGLVASLIPGIPHYELEPELVLTFFLPPLLYAAAVQTSLPGFRANLRPIGLLAVGLVAFTAAVVAVVAHLVIEDLSWAGAVALGAIVAPPDAVAATAVARRTGLPRRLVAVLEGESLVNDATALTLLRVSVAALATSSPSLLSAGFSLVMAAVGGVVVGVMTAKLVAFLRVRITDPVMDSTLSLVTPFAAFAAADAWSSGVLAVVVAGMLLGHHSPRIQSAQSRIQQAAIWATIEFLLQGVVFTLVGLQLKPILEELFRGEGGTDGASAAVACLAVAAAVVLSRPLWIFPATYVSRLIPSVRKGDPAPSWHFPAVLSWAGMRGAVSLAAALSLPTDGLEQRELLILVTFVVIGVTLLLQGASLPWVIRRLGLQAPDPAADALQEAAVKQRAAQAAELELDRLAEEQPLPDGVEDRLRSAVRHRAFAAWERLGSGPGGGGAGPAPTETPSASFTRVRRSMVEAEREVLIRARDAGQIDDVVMRRILRDLDLEETLLSRTDDD